jgi:hypothetical protein
MIATLRLDLSDLGGMLLELFISGKPDDMV